MGMAEKIIAEIVDQSATKATPSQILKAVAGFFEISPNDLVGRARNKEFVEPRQITMYLFREMLKMSYPDIASKVGKRDHTTAIYAYKKICAGTTRDGDLNQKLLLIKETVNKPG